MPQDVAFALRRLRAAPTFTVFAIVTLALGIGAATAIYSAIDSALLKPPPIPGVERVVNLYHADPISLGGLSAALRSFSTPDFADLARAQTSFSAVAAWARFTHMLVANQSAEPVTGEMVSGTYFEVMHVEAALGRTIQLADDRPGAPRVIVLSDGVWRHRFDADPAVVGRTVRFGSDVFEVIGVAPPWFRGVDMPNVTPTAAWVPLSAAATFRRPGDAADREDRWLHARARLKPDVTPAAAAAEVAAIGRHLDATHPIGRDANPRGLRANRTREWTVIPAADIYLHESVHRVAVPMAWGAMIAVGLVLLVASTNLANLFLARGSARRQEMAVRLALGASRWRLLRERTVEAALIAAAGGAMALGVARLLMDVLSADIRARNGLTLQVTPVLDAGTFGVASLATLLALLVSGVLPAIGLTRTDVRSLIASEGPGALPRWRTRRYLIAGQVAVSLLLVVLAVLCVRQVAALANRDVGFDIDNLAAANVNLGRQGYEEPRARQLLAAIVDAARLRPGIDAAAVASGLPVGPGAVTGSVTTPDVPFASGRRVGRYVALLASTPSIFETLGVDILRGRGLGEQDTPSSLPVAVIDERTARSLFGTADPIGRQILVRRTRYSGEPERPYDTRVVVGIAEETDQGVVGERTGGVLYVPYAQHYEPGMTIVVRTSGDPAAAANALRTVVARVDPELGLQDVGTGVEMGGASNLMLKITAGLTGLLGILALILAMVGLYGVLSHLVAGRTREVGVRMALGADRRRIVRMILRDGLRPVAAGVVVAVVIAALGRLFLQPILRRLFPAFDPVVAALVAAAFVAIAAAACYLPAHRAARVDPNEALRHL